MFRSSRFPARTRTTVVAASLAAALLAQPARASSPNPNAPTISAIGVVLDQLFGRAVEEASAIRALAKELYGDAVAGDLYTLALSGDGGDGAWRIDRRMDWIESLTPRQRWNHWWESTRREVAAQRAELLERFRWQRDLWAARDALRALREQLKTPRPGTGTEPAVRGAPPVHLPSPGAAKPPLPRVPQPKMPSQKIPRPRGKY